MKFPVLLLCSVLLLSISVLSQENEGPPDGQGDSAKPKAAHCEKYNLPICNRDLNPVCGDDGVTYSNECTLCVHNLEKKDNVKILKKRNCSD